VPTGTAPVPTGTSTAPVPTGTSTAPVPTGTSTAPIPTGTTTAPMPTGTSVPPPPGASEIVLQTTPFTLNPGEEAFKCQNFANKVNKNVAVVQIASTMPRGSHHMYVFDDPMFNGDTNTVETCSGTEFHDYLLLTQAPQETQKYPAGVGRNLPGNYGFRILMHYLNAGSDPIQASVEAKLAYVDTTQVAHLAAQMELNQGILSVPPGESTQSHTYAVPYDLSVFYTISHMHKQGVHFIAKTNAGTTLYETTTWDEPTPKLYDPPVVIPANTIITYSCDYKNGTGMTLTFGQSAQTNEMCIFFSQFYSTQSSSPQGQALDSLI
jgi:hypothetical protein